jgi:hypothetical protein
LNCSYGRMTESPYVPKPLSSGVPIHMCFCGDPCKVDISEDEAIYKQRYRMCSNFTWEPTERQRRSTFIVRNCFCLLINLCLMKFCILIGFETISFAADPSTALWFWVVDRHWDQGGGGPLFLWLGQVQYGSWHGLSCETASLLVSSTSSFL